MLGWAYFRDQCWILAFCMAVLAVSLDSARAEDQPTPLAGQEFRTEVLGEQVEVGALPPASCDRALLRQVWTNLVGNALKYSSKRGRPRIEIGGAIAGRERTYWVRDNGSGFDMRYYGKLFGVFQRLHGAEEFEGTGVGLAIVQRIVARHGGRVWAEGELDKGACFSFALPAESAER